MNEELDPQLLILRLRREITRLRAELAIASGEGANTGDLPDYEKERYFVVEDRIKQAVDDYLSDNSNEGSLIMNDFAKIQYAFELLKGYTKGTTTGPPQKREDTSSKNITIDSEGLTPTQLNQFQKLKKLVSHRDNEINILVGMISKLKEEIASKIGNNNVEKIYYRLLN